MSTESGQARYDTALRGTALRGAALSLFGTVMNGRAGATSLSAAKGAGATESVSTAGCGA
jgi:hypothetical protein